MDNKRPTAVLIALALLLILGIGHLFVPFVPDADKIPSVVVYGDVVLGVASMVVAVGIWNRKRWGMICAFSIAALNIVSAAPGMVTAPNLALRVVTTVYVVGSLLIIVLLAIPQEARVAVK